MCALLKTLTVRSSRLVSRIFERELAFYQFLRAEKIKQVLTQ